MFCLIVNFMNYNFYINSSTLFNFVYFCCYSQIHNCLKSLIWKKNWQEFTTLNVYFFHLLTFKFFCILLLKTNIHQTCELKNNSNNFRILKRKMNELQKWAHACLVIFHSNSNKKNNRRKEKQNKNNYIKKEENKW